MTSSILFYSEITLVRRRNTFAISHKNVFPASISYIFIFIRMTSTQNTMTSLPHKNHSDWSVHADDKVNDDDIDDDSSKSSNGLDVDGTVTTEEPSRHRRDEVKEVRNMSSQDTRRLRRWRLVVTGVLLLTAFAVTFTTYTLLQQQEDENFHTAVRTCVRVCVHVLSGHLGH